MMPTNKYVINSTTYNTYYAFFMPLVSLIWKEYIGYEPVSIFVGKPKTAQEVYILSKTIEISKIIIVNEIENIKSSTIAQISRLYAATEFNDADYLLVSDVDMFPLNKDRFNCQDYNFRFHIWNPYLTVDEIINDKNNSLYYPICYLGGQVSVWKEIMSIKEKDINSTIKNNIIKENDKWNYDEYLVSKNIKHWKGFPKELQTFNKIDNCRLDRSDWRLYKDISYYIDAHSVRPGYDINNWVKLMDMFVRLCSKQHIDWINNYMDGYLKQ